MSSPSPFRAQPKNVVHDDGPRRHQRDGQLFSRRDRFHRKRASCVSVCQQVHVGISLGARVPPLNATLRRMSRHLPQSTPFKLKPGVESRWGRERGSAAKIGVNRNAWRNSSRSTRRARGRSAGGAHQERIMDAKMCSSLLRIRGASDDGASATSCDTLPAIASLRRRAFG